MRDGRGSGDVLVWLVAKAARESHLEEIEGRDRFLVTHCLMERSRCRTEEVSRRGDWVRSATGLRSVACRREARKGAT